MANGRRGDHPITDMLEHGEHPFPEDMELLLRKILAFEPRFPDGKRPYLDQLAWERRFRAQIGYSLRFKALITFKLLQIVALAEEHLHRGLAIRFKNASVGAVPELRHDLESEPLRVLIRFLFEVV